VAGDADPVGNSGKGPNGLYKMYQKYGVKDVSLKIYPHMRHEIHNETGREVVYDDLQKFLLGLSLKSKRAKYLALFVH
jgi:alpha-beta hydrolase superfamily lysophospholipase